MKINLTKSIVALYAGTSISALAGSVLSPDTSVTADQSRVHCGHDHNRPDANAPLGVMGSHIHSKGDWMVSYRSMIMEMSQIYNGSNSISGNAGYMMAPEQMTMRMQMLGMMYSPTDKLTLMAMTSYKHNTMGMMNPLGTHVMRMKSSGLGDSSLTALYQVYNATRGAGSANAHVGFGVSLPSGDIDKKVPTGGAAGRDLPFPMQLGSGTFDFTPSITYNQSINDQWSWGGQAKATFHTGTNDSGYSLGDSLNLTSWVARKVTHNISVSGRVNFKSWSGIEGTQTNGLHRMNPTLSLPADPNNSGGSRTDLFLGVNYIHLNGVRLAAEVGKPIYQDLQGVQLTSDWTVNLGIQFAW